MGELGHKGTKPCIISKSDIDRQGEVGKCNKPLVAK